jgi:putative phosphoribosyl transferase
MAPALLPPLWRDRRAAGRALAERFPDLRGRASDALLLALPRGGVAVAAAMADRLGLPLACWAVRKIAHPASPETAIGAVAPGGIVLWDRPERGWRRLGEAERAALVAPQQRELERRRRRFGDPEPEQLRGRHLVVVDDGIATGMTVRAALLSLRRCDPASLTLAVPVVDREVVEDLRRLVDRLEALAVVADLRAVGLWYVSFEQMTDPQVLALLGQGGPPG